MQRSRALLACALLLCCWTASAVTGGNSIARHRARASQIANSAPAPSEQPVALPKPTNSTGTNSTSNSTQSGKDGIDLFQDLIQRVRENVAAEDRALKTYALEVNATCYATIARLNKTLEERLTTLAAANHTLTRSIRKLRAAQYHLNHLKPIIAKQEAMFEQVNNTLTFGNAHSSRQVELATNKSKDAQVVLSAVQAVFAMLSQLNGYNPNVTTANARFREQMQQAQNQVKDAQVLRFLETTLSSMAALPATLPSKEDIAKLRLLLSLLRSQILQYSESVQTDVKVETGLWNTRAAEYKQQLQLIKMNLERRRAEFKTQRSRGRLARLAIKASNETLTGAVFTEAQQLKVQVAFFVEDCRNKSQAYANQTANRADQLSTLAKLARVQFGAGDNDVMTRIMKGVKLPPVNRVDATGKRCCLFCETGKKPCGDKCILEEENCNTLDGCACEQPPGIA